MNPDDTDVGPSELTHCCAPLNEGRGVNPGDTDLRATTGSAPRDALNEGRGVNPGDTGNEGIKPRRRDIRSTKAEV